MANPVCHWDLMVGDLKKAKAFYTKVFDWKFTDAGMGGYWFIDTGQEPGGGIAVKPPQAPHGTLGQYFLVASIDETLKKVVAAGGTVVQPKMVIPNDIGAFAKFADPDGIVVGIFEAAKKA